MTSQSFPAFLYLRGCPCSGAVETDGQSAWPPLCSCQALLPGTPHLSSGDPRRSLPCPLVSFSSGLELPGRWAQFPCFRLWTHLLPASLMVWWWLTCLSAWIPSRRDEWSRALARATQAGDRHLSSSFLRERGLSRMYPCSVVSPVLCSE